MIHVSILFLWYLAPLTYFSMHLGQRSMWRRSCSFLPITTNHYNLIRLNISGYALRILAALHKLTGFGTVCPFQRYQSGFFLGERRDDIFLNSILRMMQNRYIGIVGAIMEIRGTSNPLKDLKRDLWNIQSIPSILLYSSTCRRSQCAWRLLIDHRCASFGSVCSMVRIIFVL